MYGAVSKGIQRWHWGKLVILWAWGGLVVALLLTQFVSQKADYDPSVSALCFLGSLLIICALTIITWLWLSGKDTSTQRRREKVSSERRGDGEASVGGN